MKYSNSSLVDAEFLSPNHSGERNHIIDTISIHVVVGQLSIETLGNMFAQKSKNASCNYAIGSDSRVALIVPEKYRSWCTSSTSNDNRAITIEVASDTTHPYKVKDDVLAKLIELCADICKRNQIKELKWQGDKTLIGQVDKQNMTVHRWFANKACPGEYLYERHGYIASEVNKILTTVGEWKQNENGWWYEYGNGSFPKNQWLKLDSWYYFRPSGYAVCDDWYNVDGKWYYFDENCRMITGWKKLDDEWYYFDNSGYMVTDLREIEDEMFYFAEDGHMCRTNEKGALE